MIFSNITARAIHSRGTSDHTIYQMVASHLKQFHAVGSGILVDIGCGSGQFWSYLQDMDYQYSGMDAIRYEAFPPSLDFLAHDLEQPMTFPDNYADVVVSLETIEHLENPRAFMRELARITKPGGLILVTTPNQLSLLSKLTLVLKNQFNAFQEAPGLYPSHITALLEVDLIRITREVGLINAKIFYSGRGRMPLLPWHWPSIFSGRDFSDNILCIGTKPY